MQTNQTPARPLIPLADYQRIFRVIHSVLDSVDADIPASSFFFSVTAAQILKKFYKLNAFPVAGAAFYLISEKQSGALSFGVLEGEHPDQVGSNRDAFHCWVQCDEYAIDFMAPLFQELLEAAGHSMPVPRLMFQKSLKRMAESVDALHAAGDFHFTSNLELTRELLQRFLADKALSNLSKVCIEWYRKPPKTMEENMALQNEEGEVSRISFIPTGINGVW
ncbi:DUF2026 family protein [Herbaspirillum lusitanum]|jgi:hypothetical protein|uniref:DUF2026 family protein n=1 Tax=Herbaspirillum lusitanum TaxID=213312 RepID=A0ABW9AI28_9BURK